MSHPPHTNLDAKGKGRDESQETEKTPYERFARLASRLFRVPVVEVLQEERRWRAEQDAKRKQGQPEAAE